MRAGRAMVTGRRVAAVVALTVATAVSSTVASPATAMTSPEAPAATSIGTPVSTAAPVPPPTAAQIASLTALVRARTRASGLGRRFTVAVVDVASGALLYSRSGGVPMRPASTMKVLTATSALTVYGPDKRWPTRVTLARYGNATHVTLVGGGDPLLGDADLAALAAQTSKRIGRSAVVVHVDDSALGRPAPGPGWTSRYVGEEVATVGALVRPGDSGPDAGAAAGKVFTAALVRAGARGARWGGRAADRPSISTTVARFAGHSLSSAVRVMLLQSNNNIAETLFRHLGVDVARDATWAGSRRAQEQILRALGVDLTGSALLDGSGLSRSNRVSAATLAGVLRLTADGRHPRLAVMLRSALPVAGRTGTLAHRYRSGHAACAAGRVRAKTGSLFDTITLAGVAATMSRRAYAFAVLVDRPFPGTNTRGAIDEIVSGVVGC